MCSCCLCCLEVSSEYAISHNFLFAALKSSTSANTYYLIGGMPNGHYNVSGGVMFTYEITEAVPYPIEQLLARGPLTEAVTVEVRVFPIL